MQNPVNNAPTIHGTVFVNPDHNFGSPEDPIHVVAHPAVNLSITQMNIISVPTKQNCGSIFNIGKDENNGRHLSFQSHTQDSPPFWLNIPYLNNLSLDSGCSLKVVPSHEYSNWSLDLQHRYSKLATYYHQRNNLAYILLKSATPSMPMTYSGLAIPGFGGSASTSIASTSSASTSSAPFDSTATCNTAVARKRRSKEATTTQQKRTRKQKATVSFS